MSASYPLSEQASVDLPRLEKRRERCISCVWSPELLKQVASCFAALLAGRQDTGTTRLLDMSCGPGWMVSALRRWAPLARIETLDIRLHEGTDQTKSWVHHPYEWREWHSCWWSKPPLRQTITPPKGAYHLIVMGDYLQRLTRPDLYLPPLNELLAPEGQLVLFTSPQFTEEDVREASPAWGYRLRSAHFLADLPCGQQRFVALEKAP